MAKIYVEAKFFLYQSFHTQLRNISIKFSTACNSPEKRDNKLALKCIQFSHKLPHSIHLKCS